MILVVYKNPRKEESKNVILIILHNPLILYGAETKTTLYGTGTTSDNWFIKLWIVAKYPKIVFATYQCEKKTSEVKKCDTIINSMNFSF